MFSQSGLPALRLMSAFTVCSVCSVAVWASLRKPEVISLSLLNCFLTVMSHCLEISGCLAGYSGSVGGRKPLAHLGF